MENQIPVQDWALPGEPFRLAAVATDAADWAALLPAAAQARMARFTEAAGRNQAGASEWLKTCWLPRELGLERVEFTTGPNGKPLLAGAAADWDFNLSHARTHAVAVLARGGAVGVDLESLARQADIARLGGREHRATNAAGTGSAAGGARDRREDLVAPGAGGQPRAGRGAEVSRGAARVQGGGAGMYSAPAQSARVRPSHWLRS